MDVRWMDYLAGWAPEEQGCVLVAGTLEARPGGQVETAAYNAPEHAIPQAATRWQNCGAHGSSGRSRAGPGAGRAQWVLLGRVELRVASSPRRQEAGPGLQVDPPPEERFHPRSLEPSGLGSRPAPLHPRVT